MNYPNYTIEFNKTLMFDIVPTSNWLLSHGWTFAEFRGNVIWTNGEIYFVKKLK